MGRQMEIPCFTEILFLTRPFKWEAVLDSLIHLAATHPRGAVVLEIRGYKGQVHYLLGADKKHINSVMAAISSHIDVNFHPVRVSARRFAAYARKIRITKPTLSLNTEIAEAVTRAGLAALVAPQNDTETMVQIILGGSYAPAIAPANLPDPNASWLSVILGNVDTATTDIRKSVKEKFCQYNFQCMIRIGISDNHPNTAREIFHALKILESAGVRIYAESEKPDKLNFVHVPWHFPLQLSVKELANFLLFPTGDNALPGVPEMHPKLTFAPSWYKNPTGLANDRSFAVSSDSSPKNLSISPRDALEHTILLGPTGSGKSTAMQHLILADIKAGRSVLVIDPKADLVNDILGRIPEKRADDVVVLDPTDPVPVGFNPLAWKNYHNPSLIADAILSVFKEIFSDCWGIYTQDLMSAALLTLMQIEGSSLLWLPILFTDEHFRKKMVAQVKDKVALRPFWQQFDSLKDNERQRQVSPVLNKMRQFLLRPGLRNVLGQAKPKFNLTDLFYQRKIVLVPLNKGITGAESAKLLGSLLVGLTWTLALSRAEIPPEKRHIVGVYIDELQDYLSLPTDLSDALAQARGLGIALTLAHQYRDQLPLNIRSGIDANARNKIIFGLNSKDAKEMAAFAPELEAKDFMLLPRYQVYTSFQSGGRNTSWIMGTTLPPPKVQRDATELRAKSQKMYGIPAEQVEKDFLDTINSNTIKNEEVEKSPIGRRKLT